MPTAIYQDYTVTTSDGSATVIANIPLDLNCSLMVEANIIARRMGGTSGSNGDSAGYIFNAMVRNVSGVSTVVASKLDFAAQDQPKWGVSCSANGSNFLISVAGAPNNKIAWILYANMFEVA